MYSNLFEHMRELRRLGLPVNVHTATLTPLPKLPESKRDPLAHPLSKGTGPLLSKDPNKFYCNLRAFFDTGHSSLYPRLLNGHLHAKIPLINLEQKAG